MASDELKVECPSCRTTGTVPRELLGQSVRCNKCQHRFVVRTPEAVSPIISTMTLCPRCARGYKVPASECGRRVVCEQCGIEFTVALKPEVTDVPVANISKPIKGETRDQNVDVLLSSLKQFWRRLTTEHLSPDAPTTSVGSPPTTETIGQCASAGHAAPHGHKEVTDSPKSTDQNVAAIVVGLCILAAMFVVCCGLVPTFSPFGNHKYRRLAADKVSELFPGTSFQIDRVADFRENSESMPGWVMVEGDVSGVGRVEVHFVSDPKRGSEAAIDNVQVNDRIVYRAETHRNNPF